MTGDIITLGLLAALALALLHAAYTDIARREIEHYTNAAIALAAPLFWWSNGYPLWPVIGWIVIAAFITFVFLGLNFAARLMGAGDAKLLSAIALWFPWPEYAALLIVMSLAGLVVSIATAVGHFAGNREEQPALATAEGEELPVKQDEEPSVIERSLIKAEVPYGVAIVVGGLWIIGERYLNHFA